MHKNIKSYHVAVICFPEKIETPEYLEVTKYLESKEKVSKDKIEFAEISLSAVKEFYGNALKYQQRWKESGFSNYATTENEINEFENRLNEIKQKED